MSDYADDVIAFTSGLSAPPVLVGWSMGGLVAMLAATRGDPPRAIVGLAPSTPARRIDDSLPLRNGEFDATEYGITSTDPDNQPAMPDLDREERVVALASLSRESRYARDERARGIIIDALPCPLLIATGSADTQWPRSRYDDIHLTADYISVDGAPRTGASSSTAAHSPRSSRTSSTGSPDSAIHRTPSSRANVVPSSPSCGRRTRTED